MEKQDYEKFKIKTYSEWDLFLHINQYPYLGRCYAWVKRESASNILNMTKEEGEELFKIVIPKWDLAINNLFNHDLINVAYFCNTTKHLHWHLIPRYNSPRTFHRIEFKDPNPTGNYSPYPKKELDEKILLAIKEKIISNI